MVPPESLTPSSRALWSKISSEFEFSIAELETLRVGLEALDRAEEARLEVKKMGAYFTDRYGQPRPHPALMVEHTSRLDWMKTVRELQLTDDVDAPRPPGIPGRYVQVVKRGA